MTDILCVGIAVLDTVMTLDSIPDTPGKYRAGSRREVGGGVAANAAVTAAALGSNSRFIGCVGDDPVGRRIIDGLESSGVDTSLVRVIPEEASPMSVVMIDREGERLIVNHTGPSLFERAQPVSADEVAGTDVVLVDMRWPGGSIPALEAARVSGIPGVVDCDHDPSENDGLGILANASHIVFSLPTLCSLTGSDEPREALIRSRRHTDAWVAATAGSDGVYWLDGDHLEHLPAFKVDVVDTLGAGDVFHGAFVVALSERLAVDAALEFASAASAIKCTRPGGRAGIPNRVEVESFLKETESWN